MYYLTRVYFLTSHKKVSVNKNEIKDTLVSFAFPLLCNLVKARFENLCLSYQSEL